MFKAKQLVPFFLCMLTVCIFAGAQTSEWRILDSVHGNPPGDMVRHYLQARIDAAWQQWMSDFEKRDNAEQIDIHYKELRKRFVESLGGFPERTPLNPQVVGLLKRDGYRVEKILFESRTRHYVTAALFLPDSPEYRPPYPGVLIPCGHYRPAKAHDEYQSMGALCALNGLAALVFDPIDQGERIQFLEPVGGTVYWGTRAHTMAGIAAILLGQNIARFEIWDGMRAIDYLQSRKDIDGERIGCTGNSGGGTQTSYLTALDGRIKAAAISCYIHRLGVQTKKSMGDGEQNIFGQLAFGMDHPDYLMMRAPVPIKILAATHDFFDIRAVWEAFRVAKRHYTRLGVSERLDIMENNAGHNYNREQRESGVAWLLRWLRNEDRPVREPDLELFSQEEMQVTPKGEVMLLEGARSVYDILQSDADRHSNRRKVLWETESLSDVQARIRSLAGIRRFQDIPNPKVIDAGVIQHDGRSVRKLKIIPEPGIILPALLFSASSLENHRDISIIIHEEGKEAALGPGNLAKQCLETGHAVLTVDLRGLGETQQTAQGDMGKAFGYDWKDFYAAYLLGKSFVGMRAEDILSCVKAVRSLGRDNPLSIHLIAQGNIGVPALHAAALESGLFESVQIIRTLSSWSDVIKKRKTFNQLINAVHGALTVYDLPDLVSVLGDRITVVTPLDARGYETGMDQESDTGMSADPILPGLAGIWCGSLDLVDPRDSDPVSVPDLLWADRLQRGREWSAEWFGTLVAPATGTVRLYVESSHGGTLKIGSGKILQWKSRESGKTIKLKMKKGAMIPIHILYNHDSGETGQFRLSWSWKGQEKHVIRQAYLRHSPEENGRMRKVW